MEHREILVRESAAYCKSANAIPPTIAPHPPPRLPPRSPHHSPLYMVASDAIITYRFRSRLFVLGMYRGYRSRVNRTGNEFSVLEKRRKQSIVPGTNGSTDKLHEGMRATYSLLRAQLISPFPGVSFAKKYTVDGLVNIKYFFAFPQHCDTVRSIEQRERDRFIIESRLILS